MNRMTLVVLLEAAILQMAGCSAQLESDPITSSVSSAPYLVPATDESENPRVKDFKTFALNALLLPLLDDDVPARWADPSFSLDCDDARVKVDGKRLDIGSPVPDAFTVRWHMEACTSMGQGIELSGDVELRVESNPDGYAASVHPKGLLVRTTEGVHAVNEPFVALLAVVDGHRP
ncbi:MAG: hypothetical protein V4792_15955 [Pseudomonadota bacterium]